MVPVLILAVGLVLVVAGVAVIYWPAALILAGSALCAVALLVDGDALTLRRPRR